jgi:hypothetical protein
MNNATVNQRATPLARIGRVLETIFQEWVLQLVLVICVFTAVGNSVLSFGRVTIV